MDFLAEYRERKGAREPLAARLRPRCLDTFVGQEHIVGPGRLLRRAIETDRLSSLLFHGPPGTGKTTLARVIAEQTKSHFMSINAVLSGVADIRARIEEARGHLATAGRRSILFVDEVHRFNRSQQDALLPHVENGTIVLVGATTENPYFEVNKALVSRSRIFQLKPLEERHLEQVLDRALADRTDGYGELAVTVTAEARRHLVRTSGGDARNLLNALELAVETERAKGPDVVVDLRVAEESIQERAVLYDKDGDLHYDIISAFIKSVRGSDADAALYWLARMVAAGENPRFIFRRMLILASEDVGLAAPEALVQVEAAARAFEFVGMPEGRYHLSQACLVLANAPKSNSTMGFFDALKAVAAEAAGEVPDHLKDASRDGEGFGHGEGYKYPHAFTEHWVAQQYLPDGLKGRVFYRPSRVGAEERVFAEVERRREASLAAMQEEQWSRGPGGEPGAAAESAAGQWMRRTLEDAAARAAWTREAVLGAATLEGESVVLDLNAGSGLLTWEAQRLARRGEVWSAAFSAAEEQVLAGLAAKMDYLHRPQVLLLEGGDLGPLLARPDRPPFDRVLGRHLLDRGRPAGEILPALRELLAPGGRAVLFEHVGGREQRLADLVAAEAPGEPLLALLREAEEAWYADASSPRLRFDPGQLLAAAVPGLEVESVADREVLHIRRFDERTIRHWFRPAGDLGGFLLRRLGPERAADLAGLCARTLRDRPLSWRRAGCLASFRRPAAG